jgi:hypothetical protein
LPPLDELDGAIDHLEVMSTHRITGPEIGPLEVQAGGNPS